MTFSNIGRAENHARIGDYKRASVTTVRARRREERATRPALEPLPLTAAQKRRTGKGP